MEPLPIFYQAWIGCGSGGLIAANDVAPRMSDDIGGPQGDGRLRASEFASKVDNSLPDLECGEVKEVPIRFWPHCLQGLSEAERGLLHEVERVKAAITAFGVVPKHSPCQPFNPGLASGNKLIVRVRVAALKGREGIG